MRPLEICDKSRAMSGERIESAVQRIEAALARIADIADSGKAPTAAGSGEAPPSVTALIEKHEALRESVSETLADLDRVIVELDQ